MNTYKEFRVISLPSEGLNAGDKYHLLKEDNTFETYIVGNNLEMYREVSDSAPASLAEILMNQSTNTFNN